MHPSEDGSEVATPVSLLEWFQQFYDEGVKTGCMIQGICEAGDVMYVPAGWWHMVINIDECLAVT